MRRPLSRMKPINTSQLLYNEVIIFIIQPTVILQTEFFTFSDAFSPTFSMLISFITRKFCHALGARYPCRLHVLRIRPRLAHGILVSRHNIEARDCDRSAYSTLPRNETALWADRNSTNSSFVEAIFPDGTYFRATLSTEKDFAGLGYNSFRSFNCWKYEVTHLYAWYSDVTCDAVYDCNHQAAAGDDKALNATTTPTASGPPGTSPATPRSEDKRSQDIALGTGIGIGLPGVIVAIIGVLIARNRKNKQSSQPTEGDNNETASIQAGAQELKKKGAATAVVPQGPTPIAHESTSVTPKPTSVDQKPKT